MRVITCNVNGLRAAAGKGFLEWMRPICIKPWLSDHAPLTVDYDYAL